MSGLPEYVAPLGAGARGRASTGVARADCEASEGRLVSPAGGGGEAGFAGAAAAPAASNVRITLPSLTLSPTLTLRSFTVESDRSHLAPGWHVHSIVVESSRYGGKKTAGFDTWIDSAAPVTRELE